MNSAATTLPLAHTEVAINIIRAVSKLALPLSLEFLNAVERKAPEIAAMERIDAKTLSRFLHSLAILDCDLNFYHCRNLPQIRNAFETVAAAEGMIQTVLNSEYQSDKNATSEAFRWFRIKSPTKYHLTTPLHSSDSKEFINSFMSHAGAREIENRFHETGHMPHGSLMIGDKVFHIRLDGPTHFFQSLDGTTLKFDGNSMLQTAMTLLECRTDEILIRIPYFMKSKLVEADIPNLFGQLLEQADGKRGAYVMDVHGGMAPLEPHTSFFVPTIGEKAEEYKIR